MKSITASAASSRGEPNQEALGSAVMADAESRFRWIHSAWFHFAWAAVVGSVYAFIVIGPAPRHFSNIHWLTPDPATQYIGWELFRQDPHLHWPLTFTKRLNYPYGESIALLDLNPLWAVALKPFSPILPEPFQYFGFEVVLVCVLQSFFALRICHHLIGEDALGVLLCSTFFLVAPPLSYRLYQHYTLSNHWLLLAAILLFLKAQKSNPIPVRRFAFLAFILGAISAVTNPYLAFPILLLITGTVASLLWQRRIDLRWAARFITILALACTFFVYSFGFFIPGGHGYTSTGYRYYSMNVLSLLNPSPFDPPIYHSFMIPRIHLATAGQYEGFNYAGGGILILYLILVPTLFLRRHIVPTISMKKALPLLVCCVMLTLMALSTKITIGSKTMLDLDPHEKLSSYLAVLRASGRLFWTPYYMILIGAVVSPFLLFRRLWAMILIIGALVFQLFDTAALQKSIYSESNRPHPTPLKSPIWSELGANEQDLIVVPPWQCNPKASPGGTDGYRIFGFLAVQQHMRINSYYSGRYTESARDLQCSQWVSQLAEQPLALDSAYVVTPLIASLIAQGPTGPGKCHDVDGFILCSAKTDFGLGSTLRISEERLDNAITDPGFEDALLSPWKPYQTIEARVSTETIHSGSHSLAETSGVGSLYQDISGLGAGHTYTVAAWMSASSGTTATGQIGIFDSGTNLATFSSTITGRPVWQLVTHSVTVSRAGTIRLHLFRNQGSGTIYWDDIAIYQETK